MFVYCFGEVTQQVLNFSSYLLVGDYANVVFKTWNK